MGSSRASATWASVLRSGLRLSLAQRGTSSGWRVSDLRGRTRLTVDAIGGRHQVLLPLEWAQASHAPAGSQLPPPYPPTPLASLHA